MLIFSVSGQKKAKLERTGAGSGSGTGSLGGTVLNKPNLSLLNSYRHTWKSRHNHFVRHSEVKQKEEKRPTVNELANTQFVLQKVCLKPYKMEKTWPDFEVSRSTFIEFFVFQVNGWKIHLLMSQVDEIIVTEKELSAKLSALQKRLEKAATKDVANKDLEKIKEGIKANLQRSRCLQVRNKIREDIILSALYCGVC